MDPSDNSSNSSVRPFICVFNRTGIFIFIAWLIIYIFFLPIFISVLYIGYKRWRKQCSVSTAMVTSHSDVFTFHIVVVEMINIVGSCMYNWGVITGKEQELEVGISLIYLALNGQTFLHVLTCVERYLAVVHPITYRNLRQEHGIRIRNVSIGCVWILILGIVIQRYILPNEVASLISVSFWWGLSLAVVSFCSFSILYVLVRPRPGEVSRNFKQTNQSKHRALLIMTAIIGALLLKILILFGSLHLFTSSSVVLCLLGMCSIWGHLPSSLILPLLFLHRAGKLPACITKKP